MWHPPPHNSHCHYHFSVQQADYYVRDDEDIELAAGVVQDAGLHLAVFQTENGEVMLRFAADISAQLIDFATTQELVSSQIWDMMSMLMLFCNHWQNTSHTMKCLHMLAFIYKNNKNASASLSHGNCTHQPIVLLSHCVIKTCRYLLQSSSRTLIQYCGKPSTHTSERETAKRALVLLWNMHCCTVTHSITQSSCTWIIIIAITARYFDSDFRRHFKSMDCKPSFKSLWL